MARLRTLALLAPFFIAACGGGAGRSTDLAPTMDLASTGDFPSKAAIDAVMQPYITKMLIHGMVLGMIDASGSVVYGYGTVGDTTAPTGDTLYEIGSLTKSFTGLWLATLVGPNVSLTDPVQNYLPSTVTVPTFNGAPITLVSLSTHTSGLPALPTNFDPANVNDPYANYTTHDLYAFCNGYTLTIAPGTQYLYSNLGEGLLGNALLTHMGGTYAADIQTVIGSVLGLVDTTYPLSSAQMTRLAPGHDASLNPVPSWNFTDALGAAGELRSSVDDLLKLAAAEAGLVPTSLDAAMALTQHGYFQEQEGISAGLNWEIYPRNVTWNAGGTGGYASFIGYDTTRHVAVVLLADTRDDGSQYLTFLGVALLNWLQGYGLVAPTL